MRIATLYTLYGRRAGAEMCFEKTLEAMVRQASGIHWTVLCNRESESILRAMALPDTETVRVPDLDNQFRKAFWLEFRSPAFFRNHPQDAFWNPSGCNHFPGRWPFPTVTTFHDLGEYHVRGKYDFKRTVFRKWICIPRSVRRSAAFTAVSRFTAEDMRRILGLDAVRVVLNGPSPYRIEHRPDARGIIARELGPDALGTPFWFVPGRTDYVGKGLDLVLAVAENALRTARGIGRIFFAGPQGDGHATFADRLARVDGGRGLFRYLGRVPEELLVSLYQECFAVILASRFEGFGFPVLEAMDAGAPVICSDAGSLPEIAGDAALLFPAGDASALEERMERLRAGPALRAALCGRGKTRSQAFSWNACGREMLGLIRSVAADGHRRKPRKSAGLPHSSPPGEKESNA